MFDETIKQFKKLERGLYNELFSNDGKLLRSTSIRTYIEDLEKLGREISGEPVAADTTSTVAQR